MSQTIHKFKVISEVYEENDWKNDRYFTRFTGINSEGKKFVCFGKYVHASGLNDIYLRGDYTPDGKQFSIKGRAGIDVRTREEGVDYAKTVLKLDEDIAQKWLMRTTSVFVEMELNRELPQNIPFLSAQEHDDLHKSISSNIKDHQLFTHLSESGFPFNFLLSKYKESGEGFLDDIRKNPYMLMHHQLGDFKRVDNYVKHAYTQAGNPSLEQNDKRRIIAKCCEAAKKRIMQNGHSVVPLDIIIKSALHVAHKKKEDWSEVEIYNALLEQDFYPIEELQVGEESVPHLVDKDLRKLEKSFALELKNRMAKPGIPPEIAINALEKVKERHPSITDEQSNAVCQALMRPISIMTGGPGVGKSFTMAAMVSGFREAWELMGGKGLPEIGVYAPTGVVSDMLHADITSKFEGMDKATTIHNALGWEKIGADEIKKGELNKDFILLDEAGMADLIVGNSLLKAAKSTAHIVLVGDPEQLAAIGVGQPFTDMIESKKIVVSSLTKTRRQKEDSQILELYRDIKRFAHDEVSDEEKERGLDLSKYDGSGDVIAYSINNAEDGVATLKMVYNLLLPQIGVMHDEVQTVVPTNKGLLGREQLNTTIKNMVNGKKKKFYVGGEPFSVGDRVMVTKTDRRKEVSNGTQGNIKKITKDTFGRFAFEIDFNDGKGAKYFSEYDMQKVTLANVVTVHKTQGAQYPCVIMPISSECSPMMLQNTLVSVGVSRAKEKLVLLYDQNALNQALNNTFTHKKLTYLKEEIKSAFNDSINRKPSPDAQVQTKDKPRFKVKV